MEKDSSPPIGLSSTNGCAAPALVPTSSSDYAVVFENRTTKAPFPPKEDPHYQISLSLHSKCSPGDANGKGSIIKGVRITRPVNIGVPEDDVSKESSDVIQESRDFLAYVFHADDKRVKEFEDMMKGHIFAEDAEVNLVSSKSRAEIIEEIRRLAPLMRMKIILLLSDVYGIGGDGKNYHDIPFDRFIHLVQEACPEAKIIAYSAEEEKAIDEVESLNVEGLQFFGREGIREPLRSAFMQLGIKCKGPLRDSTPPDVSDSGVFSSGDTIDTPIAIKKANDWATLVKNGDIKLSKQWGGADGKPEKGVAGNPEVRMGKTGPLICNIIDDQKKEMDSKTPEVLIMGLELGWEAVYLAQQYPDMKITAIEIDPELRRQAEEYIEENGMTDRITIVDCLWQDMDKAQELGMYDFVLCQGNKWDCVVSVEDQNLIAGHIKKRLNPGGQFFVDFRNDVAVERMRDDAQKNGRPTFDYGDPVETHPSHPLHSGKIVGYPVAILGEGDDRTVLCNYPSEDGDAVLAMKLTPFKIMSSRLRKAGLIPQKHYSDCKSLQVSDDSISDRVVQAKGNIRQMLTRVA